MLSKILPGIQVWAIIACFSFAYVHGLLSLGPRRCLSMPRDSTPYSTRKSIHALPKSLTVTPLSMASGKNGVPTYDKFVDIEVDLSQEEYDEDDDYGDYDDDDGVIDYSQVVV